MRIASLSLALLLAVALPLYAQHDHHAAQQPRTNLPEGENLQTPPDWKVRLDRSADVVIGADSTADIFFVSMQPGWHVTTGPAAIFYHPATTAEGTYRAETLVHLFDPNGRNEAFGLFFGGQNLDGDAVAYEYFLIRNSGEYLIKRRQGGDTSTIQNWTRHEAIQTFGADTESSVPNRLAVEVGDAEVAFFINGEEVTRVPKNTLHTDGVVGLRINHALNVHVEALDVE